MVLYTRQGSNAEGNSVSRNSSGSSGVRRSGRSDRQTRGTVPPLILCLGILMLIQAGSMPDGTGGDPGLAGALRIIAIAGACLMIAGALVWWVLPVLAGGSASERHRG